MREQRATTHACSRLSTKVEGTPAVQGSTQNGPGALLLLTMTWTNCGDIVVDAEVKIILNTKRPTVQLFSKVIEHATVLAYRCASYLKFRFSLVLQSFSTFSENVFLLLY